MRKSIIILILGLFAAAAGYAGFYFLGTCSKRALLQEQNPELAWLRNEFNLSPPEYARICELHDAYLPGCRDRCRRIAAVEDELKQLLTRTNTLTPEIEKKLADAAQLRADCQAAMLKHFYQVSQTMPPDQGRRYLVWVQQRTFLADHGMKQAEDSAASKHDRPHE